MSVRDRRETERSPVQIAVRVRTETCAIATAGTITDFTSDGAFIEMPGPLPALESLVSVEIMLPEPESAEPVPSSAALCAGRVKWSTDAVEGGTTRRTGIGVQLDAIGPEELELIEAALSHTR